MEILQRLQPLDFIFVFLWAGIVGWGLSAGFVRQLGMLVGVYGGAVLAGSLYKNGGEALALAFGTEIRAQLDFAAYVILFALAFGLIALIGYRAYPRSRLSQKFGVARKHPVYVDDARFLRGATTRKVKYTLPGPMTMVDTLFDGYYKSREKLAWAFAEILNEEARAIAAEGVDTIQFDEPAFNVYFDEVRDWGVAALERAARGLDCTTAVHICYGYGIKANIDWKKTLGGEWRQYEQTFPLLAQSAIGQVSLECANSQVPLELIGLLAGKDVLVGAIDVATDRVETPEEVAATLRAALRYAPAERLYPCTNCGMVPLSREVARGKLYALAAGARLVRRELGGA